VSFPGNRLELWPLLESDRMRNPHPVIGWPSELENLTRPQAREFFRAYYALNNAPAVLLGDLDPAEVIRTAERYFGCISAQPTPPRLPLEEPPQPGERRIRIGFPAEPQLLMSYFYRSPPVGHPDTYALTVLGSVLGDGRSLRLYKRLVEERRLTTNVAAGPWFLRYGGLFPIQATPRAPHTVEEVEAAVRTFGPVHRLQMESPGFCTGDHVWPCRGSSPWEPRTPRTASANPRRWPWRGTTTSGVAASS
jgi:hypothetical protein